ncbi:MAG: glycosyltransferase family 2 protein, partial [Leptolyngbyaceae cyanobacterium SL_7_1]|nr:glycosyltransferase family 2 protein [Leptolyngbyaceae cyanobacterium SL_7_1]
LQALRFTASFGVTAWQRFWVTQRGKFSAVAARRNQQRHDLN